MEAQISSNALLLERALAIWAVHLAPGASDCLKKKHAGSPPFHVLEINIIMLAQALAAWPHYIN